MESISIAPNQDDILRGSCCESLNHKGNAKFGRIVAKNFQEYYTAVSKMDKMLAAKGILSEIIASGAQFLKKDKYRHTTVILRTSRLERTRYHMFFV